MRCQPEHAHQVGLTPQVVEFLDSKTLDGERHSVSAAEAEGGDAAF